MQTNAANSAKTSELNQNGAQAVSSSPPSSPEPRRRALRRQTTNTNTSQLLQMIAAQEAAGVSQFEEETECTASGTRDDSRRKKQRTTGDAGDMVTRDQAKRSRGRRETPKGARRKTVDITTAGITWRKTVEITAVEETRTTTTTTITTTNNNNSSNSSSVDSTDIDPMEALLKRHREEERKRKEILHEMQSPGLEERMAYLRSSEARTSRACALLNIPADMQDEVAANLDRRTIAKELQTLVEMEMLGDTTESRAYVHQKYPHLEAHLPIKPRDVYAMLHETKELGEYLQKRATTVKAYIDEETVYNMEKEHYDKMKEMRRQYTESDPHPPFTLQEPTPPPAASPFAPSGRDDPTGWETDYEADDDSDDCEDEDEDKDEEN